MKYLQHILLHEILEPCVATLIQNLVACTVQQQGFSQKPFQFSKVFCQKSYSTPENVICYVPLLGISSYQLKSSQ